MTAFTPFRTGPHTPTPTPTQAVAAVTSTVKAVPGISVPQYAHYQATPLVVYPVPSPVSTTSAVTGITHTSSDSDTSLPTGPTAMTHPTSGSRKTGKPKQSADNKLRSRLARKAELARQSRKRKKAYIQGLEQTIHVLRKTIEEMKVATEAGIAYVPSEETRLKLEDTNESNTDSDSEDDDPDTCPTTTSSGGTVSEEKTEEVSMKLYYKCDIRRLAQPSQFLTYHTLLTSIRSLWPRLVEPVIHYYDDENDRVRIAQDSELSEAIKHFTHTNNAVKIFVTSTTNDTHRDSDTDSDDAPATRKPVKRKRAQSMAASVKKAKRASISSECSGTESLHSNQSMASTPMSTTSTISAPASPVPSLLLSIKLVYGHPSQLMVNRLVLSLPLSSTLAALKYYLYNNILQQNNNGMNDFLFIYQSQIISHYHEGFSLEALKFQPNDKLVFIQQSLTTVVYQQPASLLTAPTAKSEGGAIGYLLSDSNTLDAATAITALAQQPGAVTVTVPALVSIAA